MNFKGTFRGVLCKVPGWEVPGAGKPTGYAPTLWFLMTDIVGCNDWQESASGTVASLVHIRYN